MDSTFVRVRDILANALGVNAEVVKPESSLYRDLGAESIDLLDITFRLEREFNITIDDRELFPTRIFDNNGVKDGFITPDGMEKLKKVVPYGDFSKLGLLPKQEEIPAIFTVNTLVQFVEQKVSQ